MSGSHLHYCRDGNTSFPIYESPHEIKRLQKPSAYIPPSPPPPSLLQPTWLPIYLHPLAGGIIQFTAAIISVVGAEYTEFLAEFALTTQPAQWLIGNAQFSQASARHALIAWTDLQPV